MKTMTLTVKSTDSSFSSVIVTLQACMSLALTCQCVRSPRHLARMKSVGGTTSMTRAANCSTTLLSSKQELRKFRSFVSLVSGIWEVVDRPRDEVVFGTRWVGINKDDENKPFYRSRLVVQEHKRQADWSFFTATPPPEVLRSLFICTTVEELPNDVGQPVAWSEPVVFNVDRCASGSFLQRCPTESVCRASCGSVHGQGQSWSFA